MVALLARMGQREWAIVSIVVALLLGLLWYFFVTQPLQNRIPDLEANIQQLQSERDKGRAAQAALPQLRATIAQLEAERQAFLRELPPTEQIGQVLSLLAQRARESGVVLKTLNRTPGGPSDVANVRSTNLAITVESPFPELYVFLKQLENLQRFSTISGLNLALGGDQTANPPINTSLTMTVYTYTGQGSEAQPAVQGQPTQGQPGQAPNPSSQPGGRP
ncbi:type 4a pilus biogenesis protein PilO [Meiothermus granaticius]|uniref:Pilus assembly protein, PilO n=1 Tax=Meiothermus granaticius NBRC 107808 TaxID=1227551 RepID=A0A399FC06_9DEIN|nr:type 4a pilus biogenesis protein PilO [Meiothermus granaticius]RIH93748.1 Pilus assembly protein, PilO [Meiothermus granaticius NBRC 107808]GEM85729.1 competence protein [Meiothermus granaticius NBRC 107808]